MRVVRLLKYRRTWNRTDWHKLLKVTNENSVDKDKQVKQIRVNRIDYAECLNSLAFVIFLRITDAER